MEDQAYRDSGAGARNLLFAVLGIWLIGLILFIWLMYIPFMARESRSLWMAIGVLFVGLLGVLTMSAAITIILYEPVLWILRLPGTIRLIAQSVGPCLRARTLLRTQLIGDFVVIGFGLAFVVSGLTFLREGIAFLVFFGGVLFLIGVFAFGHAVLYGSKAIYGENVTVSFHCPHCLQQLSLEDVPSGRDELFSCSYCGRLIRTKE
jgi:hypothetical protein